ncbi:hypothetical protein P4O66_000694 [Electrophorus voltai]|uniref:Immunoglobulin domain-containing protein n=1 Tax=Electrophorus voltai TaxID=2609070 RepID=A0AAD8ZFN7_9TELE|nr:hypothetical protein P4O66_000694 [Electrophorus voltai]
MHRVVFRSCPTVRQETKSRRQAGVSNQEITQDEETLGTPHGEKAFATCARGREAYKGDGNEGNGNQVCARIPVSQIKGPAQASLGQQSRNPVQQHFNLQSQQELQGPVKQVTWHFPQEPQLPARQPPVQFEMPQPAAAESIAAECGENEVYVEVKRDLFGTGELINPADLTLGGCAVTGEDSAAQVLIFQSALQACNSTTIRVLLISAVELQGTTPSDSGVYIIRDTKHEEIIQTYTVTVEVMLSCSRCHCVLLLQLRTVIAGSFPSVKVNLHDDATLPCTQTCSGLVTWTLYHKPHDVLAQCNQTSCQSEEGFHMSHDQYLKGDLSLTITDADYTKRSLYTCACKGQELCDVSLQIEVQIKPGEPLVLDLLISESVEVIYNSTGAAAPSSGQICTVAGHSLKCKPEYTQRVLLISAVELQGTTPSDSGVYIIRDTKHEEIIQTYTVTVEVMLSCSRCHCVLLLQLRTVIAGSFPSVKVNLHDDATLPCTQTCSGLVTWTLYHKPHDVLAQCNQTSCQSEEGFHMSHDQYLKGDLSLTITDADYTKRSLYTCACKGQELCDVSLQIEVQIKPGEPLVLDLLISESVEVIYNSTGAAAPSSGQICTVAGHSLKCKPEYTQRVLLISAVELQGTTPSDSGVYIIRDTKHEEIIQTYTVTVEVMLSCSRCHCVLLLQLRTVIAGSFPSVKVNLHDDATLPCTQTCSGLVTWTLYHKPHDVLAQCNQTSCQSEEGFHMSHDQYLKGDLSLTITDADYTKRSLYTCARKGQELCDVSLQIEACNSSVQIKPGEPLVLDLLISESVEVIYNSTGAAAPSSGQICTVAGHSLKCKPEYTQRVLLISAVELQRETPPSDSGVYIIRDTKHEEIIQTYTVTVEGKYGYCDFNVA